MMEKGGNGKQYAFSLVLDNNYYVSYKIYDARLEISLVESSVKEACCRKAWDNFLSSFHAEDYIYIV